MRGHGTGQFFVFSIAPLLMACTQEPGALRIELSMADEQISPDEPISLDAKLVAVEGPVCLSRWRHYEVIARQVAGKTELSGDNRVFVCGTGLIMVLPFYPVLVIAPLLDVSDAQGRFEVLNGGEEMTCRPLSIAPDRRYGESYLRVDVDLEDDENFGRTWEPGDYEITVRLLNEHLGVFPPPLFWSTYKPTVESTIRVTVQGGVESSTGANRVPQGTRYTTDQP